ncbi:MAG TPA: hypothetical protein ENK66_01950 [Arcobacter sp.]|nr:hypothetical protein [Arcobacter sp.]
MKTLNQKQIEELEKHLVDYQQVKKGRIGFGEIAKNNLVAVTHYFKTFTVRYITMSSGMPKIATVHVLNTL